MKYYTGFDAVFINDDDFSKSITTIKKIFFLGDIKYILWYTTDKRFITIIKIKGIQTYDYTVSTQMLDDICYFDMVEKICDDIKAVNFPEITG